MLFSLCLLFAEEAEEKRVSVHSALFVTLAPALMINTDSATNSAPSPSMYSLGVGGYFSFSNGFLLETHASFFTNYYLWDGTDAQPAEVENRTATALSALLDFCSGYTWNFGPEKKHALSLMGGAGIFLRYGILSNGVESDDENPKTLSRAGDDVSDINNWFYQNLRFLYPELALSYLWSLSDTWKIGTEFRSYLPIGSLLHGEGIDGMLFSLGLKLSYK